SLWPYILSGGFLELLVPLTRPHIVELQYNACATISSLAGKTSESSEACARLVQVWDKPDGGMQSYLAAFLAVDEGMDPLLRSVAIWTVMMLLESESPELVQLVLAHPSIIKNIDKIAQMSSLPEADARFSAYTSDSGLRNSRAMDGDGYGPEDGELGDEDDDDIYQRLESMAQDVVALVQNLDR
ncbi:Vacuolar protein 8, partial [Coemansia sp. RSA 25]